MFGDVCRAAKTIEGDTHIPPTSGKGPLLAMSPAAAAEPDGVQEDRHVSKLIFFLFVIGAILLCVGVLLSIFGFQACQYETVPDCSVVLKIAGPACAVVGLGAVILARSRARLQQTEARLRGNNQGDSDRPFLCGESRQFVQCLIFGFLFLTSGMLISVLGIWVPGCGSDWMQEPLNKTDTADSEPQICGLLSLQVLGPLIVLVGLSFFVVAHVKKRNDLNGTQDASESEERQTQSLEPVQVTVGGSLSFLCLFISLWLQHQGCSWVWPKFCLFASVLSVCPPPRPSHTHRCTQTRFRLGHYPHKYPSAHAFLPAIPCYLTKTPGR